jgi:hypothetical protein
MWIADTYVILPYASSKNALKAIDADPWRMTGQTGY